MALGNCINFIFFIFTTTIRQLTSSNCRCAGFKQRVKDSCFHCNSPVNSFNQLSLYRWLSGVILWWCDMQNVISGSRCLFSNANHVALKNSERTRQCTAQPWKTMCLELLSLNWLIIHLGNRIIIGLGGSTWFLTVTLITLGHYFKHK